MSEHPSPAVTPLSPPTSTVTVILFLTTDCSVFLLTSIGSTTCTCTSSVPLTAAAEKQPVVGSKYSEGV